MSVHGVLNYLSPLDKWEEIKPYEISGRVAPGQPKNNFEFTPHDVIIHDARQSPLLNNLEENGFEWATHVTEESLETETSISKHIKEMEAFIKQHLRADMVKTFQYQIRKRVFDVQDPRVRPPSNFVHVDVSRAGAEARIRFSFPDEAERILDGRYRLLSLWRPLFSPLEDYPLAVCDANSVEDSDLVESDYIYPNFESESLLVKQSERHKWFYLPGQNKDELLIITNYDSRTQQCVPHCGFELPKSAKSVRLRESIEIKVVVFNKTENQ